MTAYQLHIRSWHYLPSFSLTTRIMHISAKPAFSSQVNLPLSSICLFYIPTFVFFPPFSSILIVSIKTLAPTAVQMVSSPSSRFPLSPPLLLPSSSHPPFLSPPALWLVKVFCFFCQQLSVFRIVSTLNSSLGFFSPFSSVRSPPLPLVTTAGTSHSMHPIILCSLPLLLQCFC